MDLSSLNKKNDDRFNPLRKKKGVSEADEFLRWRVLFEETTLSEVLNIQRPRIPSEIHLSISTRSLESRQSAPLAADSEILIIC